MRASAFSGEADERDHLVGVARVRVEAGEVRQRLATRQVAVHAASLQDDADPLAQLARALPRVVAENGHIAAGAGAVALEDLDRRGLARAVGPEQAEDLAAATSKSMPRTASCSP